MNHSPLYIASPIQSEAEITQMFDDTPIHALQNSSSQCFYLQGKRLFFESTKSGNIQEFSSNQNQAKRDIVQGSQGKGNSFLKTPLQLISNFSPITVINSKSQPQQITEFHEEKMENLFENSNFKKEEGITQQENKENNLKLNLIKLNVVKCEDEIRNSKQKNNVISQIPQCQSSIHSEQIQFQKIQQISLQKVTTKLKISQTQKLMNNKTGYTYAVEQLQQLKKNVAKIQTIAQKFTKINFNNTSGITQDGVSINQSFLHEIKSGLMEILEHAEDQFKDDDRMFKQNIHSQKYFKTKQRYQKSKLIKSQNICEQQNMAEINNVNQFQSEIQNSQFEYFTPLNKKQYNNSSSNIDSHSFMIKSPQQDFSHDITHQNHTQYVNRKHLNVDVSSSGELIARKLGKKGKNQCCSSSSFEQKSMNILENI